MRGPNSGYNTDTKASFRRYVWAHFAGVIVRDRLLDGHEEIARGPAGIAQRRCGNVLFMFNLLRP